MLAQTEALARMPGSRASIPDTPALGRLGRLQEVAALVGRWRRSHERECLQHPQ